MRVRRIAVPARSFMEYESMWVRSDVLGVEQV